MILLKNTPLLWRIFCFFAIFLVVSGTLGPMIINHSLVNRFGFNIYGGSGKALIFAAITLGLLVYRNIRHLQIVRWHAHNAIYLGIGIFSYVVAWNAITHIQQGHWGFWWPFLTHISLLITIVMAALGTVGYANLRSIYRTYKSELKIALGLGVGFFAFLTAVYGLWEVLATMVMRSVSWMLRLSGLEVIVIPPYTILLDKFGVLISQYCSGIESIALFTALYIIIGVVDREKLNFRKYAAVFVPALIALFACNILRVYGLIMAGYYIDPHIAFSLFHTYAGMFFFIIYTAIFWRITYKWMLKKS